MTTQNSTDIRAILDQITELDSNAAYDILFAARERLTGIRLSQLARLLMPVIASALAQEAGATARHLVVRATAFEPTRSQPLPVRYSVDSLYLPIAPLTGMERQEKLTVPDGLARQAEEILRALTSLASGLTPGHDLYLQLP
ncbi:hypothetical protein OIU91_42385 (plasmid) [Streptomyces sp. NBC_01456]|uniref:hypothetical protein n=1 Tax=unclassified Streptomyces TaxID=2593676 RepID=UPI002E307ADD|nr:MULTISPECIES: hypothetical protein [unclassified Streptomyces]